jgi:hypothetical protein
MEKQQFDELKRKVARRKNIYALKAKIEDYEFKKIEYNMTIATLNEELAKAKESLENLERLEAD